MVHPREQAASGKSLASKLLSAPARYCRSFRDWYVRSLLSCAANNDFAGLSSAPPAPDFSRASSVARPDVEEDYRELVRSASERVANSSPAIRPMAPLDTNNAFPRSASVNVATIDEDAPCYFDPSLKIDLPKFPPRSHSTRTTPLMPSSAAALKSRSTQR